MTEMIRELMIQSVGAFLAIFGFSLLVDMPRKYLVYAGITGGAGWLAYLVSMQVGTSQVAAAFFSSLAAALLSQVFARVLKAPVTIFLVAGILPTVPGASIYRSVYFLIQFLSDPDDPDSGGDGGCHLYCGFTVPSAPE